MRKLFFHKNPYDFFHTKDIFFSAVKENVKTQCRQCPQYLQLIQTQNFSIQELKSEDDLYKIPVISSLYFKRNQLFSVPQKRIKLVATSSGTKGAQSNIGFDRKTLFYGIAMVIRFFSYHKLISAMPTNYIMLGYEPGKHSRMGAVKTAYGASKFAPAINREYALKGTGQSYELNIEGMIKALQRYEKQGFPVRFVGFPSLMYLLVKTMREKGISVVLNPRSKILLGGGWKQFSDREIDRDSFFNMIAETLGMDRKSCYEFFSAVEHPLPYCKCENGHFHVPIYSRVIIRDIKTLNPVPAGQIGLLSFVSPLVSSMPLTSIVTDDLAVLYDGDQCDCGIGTPYFELKGRAGVRQIKTCAAETAELLAGAAK